MKLTFEDTKFIRDFEGCVLSTYPDPASKDGKPFSIGYGDTGPWVVPDLIITQFEADARFMKRIDGFCDHLNACIQVKVNKNQYVALLSLMYNIGAGAFAGSTLLKKLNNNQPFSAAAEFSRWNRAGGRVIPGLTRRRKAEMDLFLTP